jgi:hypothetical protein
LIKIKGFSQVFLGFCFGIIEIIYNEKIQKTQTVVLDRCTSSRRTVSQEETIY